MTTQKLYISIIFLILGFNSLSQMLSNNNNFDNQSIFKKTCGTWDLAYSIDPFSGNIKKDLRSINHTIVISKDSTLKEYYDGKLKYKNKFIVKVNENKDRSISLTTKKYQILWKTLTLQGRDSLFLYDNYYMDGDSYLYIRNNNNN